MTIASFDEALETTLELAAARKTATIDLWKSPASTGYLAEPVTSAIDLPNFDRSMMDGYAIHLADLANTTETLTIVGDIRAGDARCTALTRGCAVKVRTGASVPVNCAAVVRQEQVEQVSPDSIRILKPVKQEESIQRRGEDAKTGDVLLASGSILNGQSRAVLKSAGVTVADIYESCSVALLCTGSELVHDARPLRTGEIYAANDAFLADSLRALGAVVVDTLFVEDNLDAMATAVERYMNSVDYLFITGGTSVGDTDFAKAAIRKVAGDAQLPIERVWMRPGSPFVATRIAKTTVFALSGNPAACFVQFHALSRHAVEWTLGRSPQAFSAKAVLAKDIVVKPVKHTRLYRATVRLEHSQLIAYPQAKQSSGSITGLSSTNALIRLHDHHHLARDVVAVQFTASSPF